MRSLALEYPEAHPAYDDCLSAWKFGDNLLIAVLFAATPTAVASFVMADQMGADRNLAAAVIVVSTLLAFPALAVVMLLMR